MPKARTLEVVLTPIVIDDVHPRTPGGFPAKAVGGERVPVSAQLVADGHDRLGARVRWRRKGDRSWESAPLRPGRRRPLDRLHRRRRPIGLHELVVDAWTDRYATWRHEIEVKAAAGQDVELELEEGARHPRGPRRPRCRAPRPRSACSAAAEGVRRDELLAGGPAGGAVRRRRGRAGRRASPDARLSSSAVAPALGRPAARRPRRLVRAVPAELRRAEGRHRAPELRRRPRLRRRVPAARSTRSAPPTARAAATASPPVPTTPAARGPSAVRRAATTPSTPTSAPSRTSTPSSTPPRTSASRWRWTTRSSAAPTTPGCATIPSGSSSVPTARSATPRTRRRSTRTSTRSSSGRPTTPTAWRCGRRAATSSSTGSATASARSASTTRTPSRWRSGSG